MNITELYHGLVTGNAKGVPSAAALFELVSGGIGPEEIKTNPLIAPLVSLIKTEADVFARSGITALPFSLYKLFDTTGNRLSYEGHYFERRRRLLTLSLASWLWKQEDHIAALEDTIWAICDEYSWCLPAHMANKSLGGMDVRRRLDLFACETGFAIAECLAMTGSLLNPAVSRRATDEVLYRIIESYMNSVTPQRWEMMDNNWCAVCAGSIAGTACYLIPDALQLAGILCRLAPTFDRYIASFESDGTCTEGLSYWTYGVGFYVCTADILFHRTSGVINLLGETGFDRIARFQQYCYFPGGATLNFSDASKDGNFRLGLNYYLARHIEGVSIPVPRNLLQADGTINPAGYPEFIDHCGRFCLALRDLIWTGKSLQPQAEECRAITLPAAQWLLCSGAGGTGFAAKGGHNGESHNHNDIGNFIFYKKGAMFLYDIGAGEYTKDYFSDNRYEIFCLCSESHNLPIIGGQGQKPGREYRAGDCRIDDDGTMTVDLAPAYAISGLQRLERSFRFDMAAGTLFLRDSFVFSGEAPPVTERFILHTAPRLEPGGFSLSLNGEMCALSCQEQITPRIAGVMYRDHEGKDAQVFTVDFPFPQTPRFSVEFVIR